jgi:ATP-dependent DNA helicase RecG
VSHFTLDNSPILALEKLKFLVGNRPTTAALLLFSETPLRHHIHIGRFKSPSMIIDDRQITDTLFEAVGQSMKFIVSHISVIFTFYGSLQRQERFAYPWPALCETLLNAVVHRDYTNPSDIQIKILDDRITFFSPGKLVGGLTVDDLKTDTYQSHLRNKLVAEAFYLTRNIEKYGSDFIRIRKELEAYQKVEFSLEEVGAGVLVTLRRGEGVSEGISRLLDCIREKPGLRIPELSGQLHVPAKIVEPRIKKLRDENRIVFKGAPKTSGHFMLDDQP